MSTDEVVVPDWPVPRGYANGRIGAGRVLHVGGQIGWNSDGKFPTLGDANFSAQFAQTLDNVLAVVTAAGGRPEDIADMTVFVVDMAAYRSARRELATSWRQRMGKHYPAIALVSVTELFEVEALVEIKAVAYIGDKS